MQRAPFWQQAPFFRLLPPFILGIVCTGQGWLPLPLWLLLIALPVLLSAMFFAGLRAHGAFGKVAFSTLLHFFFFIAGCCIIGQPGSSLPKRQGGVCTAVVTAAPYLSGNTLRLTVRIIAAANSTTVTPMATGGFVYIPRPGPTANFNIADTIVVPHNWERITNAGNPFEFDFSGWCARQGIFYRQFCDPRSIKLLAARKAETVFTVSWWHTKAMKTLQRLLPDTASAGLAQSMLLGDETNLDDGMRSTFSQTGIAHILAISGGNIFFLLQVVLVTMFWLRHKKYLRYKYLLALVVVWCYILLTGIAPSALRSGIMFIFLTCNIYFSGSRNAFNSLCASAMVMLCIWPQWLFSLGFQLSFAAVISLIVFYGPVQAVVGRQYQSLRNSLARRGKKEVVKVHFIISFFIDTVATTLSASILIAPLIIYYFHSFPPLFIVANILAAVFSICVLVAGMLLLILSPFTAIAKWLGSMLGFIIHAFCGINSTLVLKAPFFSHLVVGTLGLLLLYVAIAGIGGFLLFRFKPAFYTGLVAVCTIAVSGIYNERISAGQRSLIVYNTRNGCLPELIEGHTYSRRPDTAWNSPANSNIAATAHINMCANQPGASSLAEVLMMHGKRVVLLTAPPVAARPFAADIVIDICGCTDVSLLHRLYTPTVIVAGNNIAKARQLQMCRQAARLGIQMHITRLHGAYVF